MEIFRCNTSLCLVLWFHSFCLYVFGRLGEVVSMRNKTRTSKACRNLIRIGAVFHRYNKQEWWTITGINHSYDSKYYGVYPVYNVYRTHTKEHTTMSVGYINRILDGLIETAGELLGDIDAYRETGVFKLSHIKKNPVRIPVRVTKCP